MAPVDNKRVLSNQASSQPTLLYSPIHNRRPQTSSKAAAQIVRAFQASNKKNNLNVEKAKGDEDATKKISKKRKRVDKRIWTYNPENTGLFIRKKSLIEMFYTKIGKYASMSAHTMLGAVGMAYLQDMTIEELLEPLAKCKLLEKLTRKFCTTLFPVSNYDRLFY